MFFLKEKEQRKQKNVVGEYILCIHGCICYTDYITCFKHERYKKHKAPTNTNNKKNRSIHNIKMNKLSNLN